MEMKVINKHYPHTWLYPYADQTQFNIIYCLDTEEPLKSIMNLKRNETVRIGLAWEQI